MHLRHSDKYQPVTQHNALLPKLETEALGKPEARGEQRIFLCYFEKHRIMNGSILSISLRSPLTGGKIFLHRSRDLQAPAELVATLATVCSALEFGFGPSITV